MLAVTVMCGTVMGSYQEAQAAELVAGYGLAEILTSFFMSVGLTIGVKDLVDNGDLQKKLDKWMQSDYDRIYEKYMQSYPNLPDQTPSPIPSPEISPPATVDTDKQLPATYEQLKEQAATDGVLEMVPATFFCLATAIQDLWDKFSGSVSNVPDGIPEDVVDTIVNSGCPYFDYRVYKDGTADLYLGGIGSYAYSFRVLLKAPCYWYYNGNLMDHSETMNMESGGSSFVSKFTNLPVFATYSQGKTWSEQEQSNTDLYQKNNYWPSTDLKDDYDNNTSPDLPSIVVPPIIRVPTLDEIKELLQQGSDDEENRPTYVTNFITNHTVQPTPDPEPTEAPDAKPTPTIAVVPNPGGDTDPDATPAPSTTPAVNPDPGGDGGDNTDPDNPDPTDPTPEEEASPYKADLREIFPFCIPFDLINLFKVFDAEPEAPVFKIPIELKVDNPFTGKSIVNYEDTIKIDLSDYEQPIKAIRIFEVIFFLIGLMLITRSHMIKG